MRSKNQPQENKYVSLRSQIWRRGPRSHAARVDILNNAVKVTLGPKGRNVVLDKSFGAPRITRTASPSPRKSSLRTSSRTWAPRWCAKWPPRRPTLPAMAPPPRPCWRLRSYGKAPSRLPPHESMDLKRGIDLAVDAVGRRPRQELQEGHLERGNRPGRPLSRPTATRKSASSLPTP